jgi:hypothetical protein
MVSGEGTARLLTGAEAQEANHRVRAKYVASDALGALERAWGPLDDVAIELTPSTWRSWTGTLLHEEAARELETPYDAIWLADE